MFFLWESLLHFVWLVFFFSYWFVCFDHQGLGEQHLASMSMKLSGEDLEGAGERKNDQKLHKKTKNK